MEILGKLFGSMGIVKILRLFLFNPNQPFERQDIIERTGVSSKVVSQELSMLSSIGFVRKKTFYKPIVLKHSGRTTVKKRKVSGLMLNAQFKYLDALRNFLIDATLPSHEEIARRFRKMKSVKLVIASGIFTKSPDGEIDLLVVGNGIRQKTLEMIVRKMEAELGKELRYAYFTVNDYIYRLNMYDKLIRDVYDYQHMIVINRLESNK